MDFGLLSICAAYDLEFITKEKCIELIEKTLQTITSLQKWNGHLYNWYNIKTKKPLIPRYVSTVDSGNLVGYMYTTRSFLKNVNAPTEMIDKLTQMIEETKDFVDGYYFSIPFNRVYLLEQIMK